MIFVQMKTHKLPQFVIIRSVEYLRNNVKSCLVRSAEGNKVSASFICSDHFILVRVTADNKFGG